MYLAGAIYHHGGERSFTSIGVVDVHRSFIGREREAAVEWVRGQCVGLLTPCGNRDAGP